MTTHVIKPRIDCQRCMGSGSPDNETICDCVIDRLPESYHWRDIIEIDASETPNNDREFEPEDYYG